MTLFRPTHLQIRLDHLISNFQFLRQISGGQSFLCPMIKANAYGHGDVAVAKALASRGCEFFGVACVEEGVGLRESHVDAGILVFGFHGLSAVRELIAHSLTPVVSNFEQLNYLSQEVKEPLKIHLKFNTGMNRLGFSCTDVLQVKEWLHKSTLLEVEGICTHFFNGENLMNEGQSSQAQLSLFESINAKLSCGVRYQHVYNSSAMAALYQRAGVFEYGCRPGLLVYGIDPNEKRSLNPLISPVMEFKSKIVGTQAVKLGEVVSYGGTWQATEDSTIGIVPAGYADGVRRGLSNRGEVLVCGQRAPIRGRVCMDYTMIDLTKIKKPATGFVSEEVVLIGHQQGEQIFVEDVAQAANCTSYEVATGISERVPRLYGALK